MLKLSWDINTSNASWVGMLRARFFKHRQPVSSYFRSSVCSVIKGFIHTIEANTASVIGDGDNINFWRNKWLSKPVVEFLNVSDSCNNALLLLSEILFEYSWFLPAVLDE